MATEDEIKIISDLVLMQCSLSKVRIKNLLLAQKVSLFTSVTLDISY